LVCREMSLGGGHDVPDRPSGSGHPVAFTLQGLAEGVVDDHGAKPILVANATRSQLRYAGTRRTECTHLTDFWTRGLPLPPACFAPGRSAWHRVSPTRSC